MPISAILTQQSYTRAEEKALLNTKVPVYGLGKNLLNNWYFIAPFPVNTIGRTNPTTINITNDTGTMITDGWIAQNQTSFDFSSAGLRMWKALSSGSGRYIYQEINGIPFLSKSLTASMVVGIRLSGESSFITRLYTQTGVVPSSLPETNQTILDCYSDESKCRVSVILYTTGNLQIRYYTSDDENSTNETRVLLKALKLELGETQTLAHYEGTIVTLNEIPNYKEELNKSNQIIKSFFSQSVSTSNTVSGQLFTIKDNFITPDTIVLSCNFANPEAIISDVSWTSTIYSITFTGVCFSQTTADIILGKNI